MVGASFSGANEPSCVCGLDTANVLRWLRCELACVIVASPARFRRQVVTPRLMSDS